VSASGLRGVSPIGLPIVTKNLMVSSSYFSKISSFLSLMDKNLEMCNSGFDPITEGAALS